MISRESDQKSNDQVRKVLRGNIKREKMSDQKSEVIIGKER